MNFRVLIFVPGIFMCETSFAQDTLVFGQDTLVVDSVWEVFGTPVEYNAPLPPSETKLSDSINGGIGYDTTALLDHDTGICVSIPIRLTLYVPYVEHDNNLPPPVITFIDSPTPYPWGGWSWRDWHFGDPWQLSFYPTIDPYRNWYEINLFDTTRMHFSRIGFAATRALEVSTFPPSEVPDPAKPASLPAQPWYEAILPSAIRARRA